MRHAKKVSSTMPPLALCSRQSCRLSWETVVSRAEDSKREPACSKIGHFYPKDGGRGPGDWGLNLRPRPPPRTRNKGGSPRLRLASSTRRSHLSLMTLPRHEDTTMQPTVVAMMAWMEDTSLQQQQQQQRTGRRAGGSSSHATIRALRVNWSGTSPQQRAALKAAAPTDEPLRRNTAWGGIYGILKYTGKI
ncbi:hypothetical protein CRUP_010997 [Coryphaenoides rupestris]|nr:hypothetical protein CRUP_010997 [Coryphaenoides rupestris]